MNNMYNNILLKQVKSLTEAQIVYSSLKVISLLQKYEKQICIEICIINYHFLSYLSICKITKSFRINVAH